MQTRALSRLYPRESGANRINQLDIIAIQGDRPHPKDGIYRLL
jgi:hypothetical protein